MTIIKQWTKNKLNYSAFTDTDECPDMTFLGEYSHTPAAVHIDRQGRGDMKRREYRYFNLGTGDAEYIEADYERYEAYSRGDWYMMVVGVEISVQTTTNWAKAPIVGRAYLHGIESDSEQDYINTVVKDLTKMAEDDLRALKQALCFNPQE